MGFKEELLYDTPTEGEFMQIIKWKEDSDCDFQNFDKNHYYSPYFSNTPTYKEFEEYSDKKMIDKSTSFTTPPSNIPPSNIPPEKE